MSNIDMDAWPDSFKAPPSEQGSVTEIGSPVWELARWMPSQGSWTEDDYFELDGPAVEFDQGIIEVLPMPSQAHQLLVQFFFLTLHTLAQKQKLGRVLVAPVPVKLWSGKFREPDVVFLKTARITETPFCEGADLVLEVVSDGAGNRRRDFEVKPREYAKAGIAEYWLLDPVEEIARVHLLSGTAYQTHDYHRGETAMSTVVPGLSVDVANWLSAGSEFG